MAAELKTAFPTVDIKMLPSSGGVFEVVADKILVFSKKGLRRHAEPGEVVALIQTGKSAV